MIPLLSEGSHLLSIAKCPATIGEENILDTLSSTSFLTISSHNSSISKDHPLLQLLSATPTSRFPLSLKNNWCGIQATLRKKQPKIKLSF